MTPVLHVSREVADALPAGLSIAPVEEQWCGCCGGYGWIAEPDPSTGEPINPQQCPTCRGDAVLPPVLSGRIAIAVPCPPAGSAERHGLPVCTTCDGKGALIIGTATATDVLPVVPERGRGNVEVPNAGMLTVSCDGKRVTRFRWRRNAWTHEPTLYVNKESTEALARFLPALDLSPGQWVVTIEDWAPTTDRCPRCWGAEHLPCTDPMCEPDDGDSHVHWVTCPTCDGVGSCPPVPVAAALDGTITTWEAM